MKKLSWWVLAVLVAAGGAGAWWWAGKGGPDVTFRTARIELGSLQAAVAATGTVNPVSQVQVGTQVSGQVRELLVDFNSEVRQGQLIARIDPESFEYRVRQATADLEVARASVLTAQATVQQALAQSSRAQMELQEAQRDVQRKQDLLAQNFISPAEADAARVKATTLNEAWKAAQAQVEVARAQAQAAQATVKQRDAQLQQARVDLERTQIRSPVDGIVIKRSVEMGQTVAASLQAPELFIIARNLSDMQVEASIDEADVSRVRVGQPVHFTVDAFPGRHFEGRVRQLRKAAINAQNVITYVAVVGFTNHGGNLLPGMTANVRIVTDTRDDVLKVPNAALRVRMPGVEVLPGGGPSDATRHAAAPADAPRRSGTLIASAQAQPLDGAGRSRDARTSSGAVGGPAGAAGPLRELRERIVQDLGLTPAQLEQVDRVMAEARPRFGELRKLPDDERAPARERVLSDVRAGIAAVLTPAQKQRYEQMQSEAAVRPGGGRGRIYVLDAAGRPRGHDVRLGVTDGSMTELLVVPGSAQATELVVGTTVVTGVIGGNTRTGPAPGRQPGPRLMF